MGMDSPGTRVLSVHRDGVQRGCDDPRQPPDARSRGWTNPVLVDGSNGIIAGHGRVLAATKLGMAEVPCIELAHLTAEQRRAYVIADNQTALRAGWDNDLLKLELDALDAADFDLAPLGFAVAELAAVRDTRPVGATDPDDCPAAPVNPVSATGDLWCLGRHRVLCGDATCAEHVAMCLGGAKVDCVFTSPPYAEDRARSLSADHGSAASRAAPAGTTSEPVSVISEGHLEKWRLPSNHANLICDFTICGLGDDGTAGLF
jgi:ParB-like nuclease domain